MLLQKRIKMESYLPPDGSRGGGGVGVGTAGHLDPAVLVVAPGRKQV